MHSILVVGIVIISLMKVEAYFARFGGNCYHIKAEIQIDQLFRQINRFTYKDKPTKRHEGRRSLSDVWMLVYR